MQFSEISWSSHIIAVNVNCQRFTQGKTHHFMCWCSSLRWSPADLCQRKLKLFCRGVFVFYVTGLISWVIQTLTFLQYRFHSSRTDRHRRPARSHTADRPGHRSTFGRTGDCSKSPCEIRHTQANCFHIIYRFNELKSDHHIRWTFLPSLQSHSWHPSHIYLLLRASESPDALTGALRGMDSLLPLLCWILTDCAGFLLGGPHILWTYYPMNTERERDTS